MTALRIAAIAAGAGFFLFGGLAVGVMALSVAAGTFMLCMSSTERTWVWMTLTAWAFIAVMVFSGTTACPDGAPNHCAAGR